ncbi:MAG: hypothetical protein P4L77_03280 [Sulfuriferula sp.]|nr:hypothetical protein [Sulfuriferula sp.]
MTNQPNRLPYLRIVGIPLLCLTTLTLTGCQGDARVDNFTPTAHGISDDTHVAGNTNPKSGLGGKARLEMQPDEIVAGFERSADANSGNIQHFYRGAVKFNLDAIRQIPSKVIDKAILHFNIRQSYVSAADGSQPQFPNITSCAGTLWNASADWAKLITSEGYATTPLPKDALIRTLPDSLDGRTTGISADVTEAVRYWLIYPSDNFGFILQGRDETVTAANNSACATRYGDFTLEVHYTVFPALFSTGS